MECQKNTAWFEIWITKTARLGGTICRCTDVPQLMIHCILLQSLCTPDCKRHSLRKSGTLRFCMWGISKPSLSQQQKTQPKWHRPLILILRRICPKKRPTKRKTYMKCINRLQNTSPRPVTRCVARPTCHRYISKLMLICLIAMADCGRLPQRIDAGVHWSWCGVRQWQVLVRKQRRFYSRLGSVGPLKCSTTCFVWAGL